MFQKGVLTMLVRMAGTDKVLRGLTPEQASELAAKWGARNGRVVVEREQGDPPVVAESPRVDPYTEYWQFGPTSAEAKALEAETRGKFRQVVHCTMEQLARARR